jgi:hypothetical protein
MSLVLGKSLNRNYNLRLPFLDGFYNIGLFYNTRSPFLLFSVDPDISFSELKHSVKVNMFKNVESSRFVETFLNLHNYKSYNLDIINQFKEIKPDYTNDVNFMLNENLVISKVQVEDNTYLDQLVLYGLTLTSYSTEMIFLIAERQNIVAKLRKKVVRTSAIQISTLGAMNMVDEYFEELKNIQKKEVSFPPSEAINFNELENEEIEKIGRPKTV